MKKSLIICSGGLDSVTLAHYVKKQLKYGDNKILFFDYGQRARRLEEICARTCSKEISASFVKVKINNLDSFKSSCLTDTKKFNKIYRKNLKNTKKESSKWYLPFRNGIFLAYALSLAEKDKRDIFIGFKSEGLEGYPDATKHFVKVMNEISIVACDKVKILAPFLKKDKEDIVLIGSSLKVDFAKTTSCYVGSRISCGECLACALRKEAFYWAAKEDPTKYRK